MDKKNIALVVSLACFGILLREHLNLIHDFILLNEAKKEDEEIVEKAKEIATNALFIDLAERFEEG